MPKTGGTKCHHSRPLLNKQVKQDIMAKVLIQVAIIRNQAAITKNVTWVLVLVIFSDENVGADFPLSSSPSLRLVSLRRALLGPWIANEAP